MKHLLLSLLLGACEQKPLQLRSSPVRGTIVVDGDGSDWSEVALEKIPDVDASFSVQHDAENIYMLVLSSDATLGALMRRELRVIVAGEVVSGFSRVTDDRGGIYAIEVRVPWSVATLERVPIELSMKRPKKEDDGPSRDSVRFGAGTGGTRPGGAGQRSPLASRPPEDHGPPEISLKLEVTLTN